MGQVARHRAARQGNVVNLGGPPANSQSLEEYQGIKPVIASCPEIQFIGQTPYNVTNWDPAQTQKVVTALLAKYPKIDAITTDFGAALASSFGAFKQAGRKIPAVATEDSNQLSCDQKKLGFQLFTVDSQNWMVRAAVDFAVAKATGGHSSRPRRSCRRRRSRTRSPASPTRWSATRLCPPTRSCRRI